MSSQKIFCIGLNKTGTTSLHKAFEILGYNSVHYSSKEGNIQNIITNNYKDNALLLKGLEHYDVILDWNDESILDLYKVFDQQYPNSKFILNTRDLDGWINSREKHVLNISDLENLQKNILNILGIILIKQLGKNYIINIIKVLKTILKTDPMIF